MTSNRKCVVLGGDGFIGTNLCRRLTQTGYNVRAFGRRRTQMNEQIEWFQGDFNDETAVAAAIEGFDVVIHLIHATTPASANIEKVGDVQRSVIGTIKLLEACVMMQTKKLIFVSSGGTVYGPNAQVPITEDAPTLPISVYGVNKLVIENYLNVFQYLHGLKSYVVRLANPFGPYQTGLRNHGIIPTAAKNILHGNPITIYGDGSAVRDYVYIDDVVTMFEKLMTYEGGCRVFNVGGGGGKSIRDVISAIEQKLDRKAEIVFLPARPFDVPSNVLSIQRAMAELHWQPDTSFNVGLDKTLVWLTKARL